MRRITCGLDSEAEGLVADLLVPSGTRLTPVEHWKPRDGLAAPIAAGQLPALPGVARPKASWIDRALLAVEVLAVVGLAGTMVLSFGILRDVQQDVRAMPAASSAATATAVAAGRPELQATFTLAAPTRSTPALPPTATAALQPPPAGAPVSTTSPTARAASPTDTPWPTATAVPTPISPTGVRFLIPAIGVDAPMVEGDNWETLKDGIGHRIGTAWPGQVGNVVISAHNDVYGAIFRRLNKLQPGDMVLAQTPTGVYRYEVMSSRVVLPTEVSVTQPTDEPTLTMITCYPPFVDTHRIVVTARLVE